MAWAMVSKTKAFSVYKIMDRLKDKEFMEEVKECFAMHDRQNSGKIPCSELGYILRCLGMIPTEKDVGDIVNNVVRKNAFDLNDLLSSIGKLQQDERNRQEELREAFAVFDRDGAGMISAAELRHVVTKIGEPLKDEDVDEMVREMDVDNQGQFQYEEFVRAITGVSGGGRY